MWVKEEVGAVAEVTAESPPRAARAVSNEVMFIISLDPSWDSKVEVVVEVEVVVVVGAVMVGETRGGGRRAHELVPLSRWNNSAMMTQQQHVLLCYLRHVRPAGAESDSGAY